MGEIHFSLNEPIWPINFGSFSELIINLEKIKSQISGEKSVCLNFYPMTKSLDFHCLQCLKFIKPIHVIQWLKRIKDQSLNMSGRVLSISFSLLSPALGFGKRGDWLTG